MITGRLDRDLPLAERVILRLHLAACDACPRFDHQVKLMHAAMARWRSDLDRDPSP